MSANGNLPMVLAPEEILFLVFFSALIALLVHDLIKILVQKHRSRRFEKQKLRESLRINRIYSVDLYLALLKGILVGIKLQTHQPISEVHAMDRNIPELPDRSELFLRLKEQSERLGITVLPIMDRKTFAKTVGITDSMLTKLISRDYIPAVKFDSGIRNARFSPVNVAALWTVCLEQAKDWQARQGE